MLCKIGAQWEAGGLGGGVLWVNERGLSQRKSKHAASWFVCVCVWRVKVSEQGAGSFYDVYFILDSRWIGATAPHLERVVGPEDSWGGEDMEGRP